MEKSATDIMQDSIVAAVLDAITAWKAASGGLPNVLARDLGAVHRNTTLADLPKEVQAAVRDSTRAAFNRLLKEGYNVAKGGPPPRASSTDPRPPRSDTPPPAAWPRQTADRRDQAAPARGGPGSGGRGGPPRGR